MTVRISELAELSSDIAQSDILPIVDIGAQETKKVQVGNLLLYGISGMPSGTIDLSRLNQSSVTKLTSAALAVNGVASGTYGNASTIAQFSVNDRGLVTFASGVAIVIPATSVTGLATVATSGTYSSLTGLPTLGTISSQDANAITISGGTISGVIFTTGNATISGGTITNITDLAIADGGTGASTASEARTNLGLSIGSDVQAYNSILSGITQQFTAADQAIYSTASGVLASAPFTALGRSIVSGSTAATVRTTIGLGSIATQDAGLVAISGGTISGISLDVTNPTISGGTIVAITDLAISDGGTGASTASGARANLGLSIGSDVQAYSSVLSGVALQFNASDQTIYSTASGVLASTPLSSFGRSVISGASADAVRTTLGLGSIATQDNGSVTISGGNIFGIVDLAIADGGTGASTASDARTNLGLAIGTNIQAFSSGLSSIAGISAGSGTFIYSQGTNNYTAKDITNYALNMLASGDSAASTRSYLGLGLLAVKDSISNVDILPASISGASLSSGTVTSREIGSTAVYTNALQDSSVTTVKIVDNGVTAAKMADNSTTIVDTGAPIVAGDFVGQHYFDTATSIDYVWDGDTWERQAGITNIAFTDSTPLSFSVAYADRFSAQITTSLDNQSANTFFAGPSSGVATTPAFRTLSAADLPIATASGIGGITPGAGLSVTAGGILNHSNAIAPGTYTGAITIDAQGHITNAAPSLTADQIPALDASKITTGQFSGEFLAPNSVTASQLADYGIAQVSESAPVPEFAGQWWINPNDRSAYIWVGEVTPVPNGYWLNLGYGSATQVNLRFGGTYNASGNIVESINSYGIEAGLTVGQALSAPSTSNNGVYLIVTASGVGTSPAPNTSLSIGNWVLSQGVGATWTKINLSSAVAGVADQDVLVDGNVLNPIASGVASQEDFNEVLWARVQTATTISRGIVQASSEIIVASGTGTMTIGIIDDGSY